MLCQFLHDSDCETWWVSHRKHGRAGESLSPDRKVPAEGLQPLLHLLGSLEGDGLTPSTGKECWVDIQDCLMPSLEHQTLESPSPGKAKLLEHSFTEIMQVANTKGQVVLQPHPFLPQGNDLSSSELSAHSRGLGHSRSFHANDCDEVS